MPVTMDPSPHPRDLVIEAAARELVPWLNDWKARHKLVSSEYLFLLATVTGRHLQAVIVAEREGVGGEKAPAASPNPDLSFP